MHRLEALTGASVVLRGLQLVITGRPTQIERAAAVVELVRPIWQDGQSVVTLLGEHKELTSTGMLAGGCFIMAQPYSPTYVSYVKVFGVVT